MLVITGRGASGKDGIVKRLISKYDYKRIITYTTRPMRDGEKDGVNYHYLNKEDFKSKVDQGFFLEYQTYKVASGEVWYYGTALEDIKQADDKSVIILTPDGLKALKNKDIKVKSIGIHCTSSVALKRMALRGDNKDEALRRVEDDQKRFAGLTSLVDKVIINNGSDDINTVVDNVHYMYTEKI